MNQTVRFMFALAFAGFVGGMLGLWLEPTQSSPWWLPLATATGLPFCVGTLLAIMQGPSVFWRKDW